ncbi:MAG: hypothetical protein WC006_07900 [Bacilli bacterium]
MSKYDYCKICRKYKDMTKEHIPPRSTFNKSTIRVYPFEQVMESMTGNRLPWDYNGFRFKQKQGGNTFLTLCKECNSYMGVNYVPEYNRIVKGMQLEPEVIAENSLIEFDIPDIKPLNFIKEVIAMFCSLSNLTKTNPIITNFLLDKYEKKFPSNYKVFMNIYSGELIKANADIVISRSNKIYHISEIASYPMSFVLIHNAHNLTDEELHSIGADITEFTNYNFDEEVNMTIALMIREHNNIIPLDNRTKKQIEEAWGIK